MKAAKLTDKQAAQITKALELHRMHREHYWNIMSAGAFPLVAAEVLKARKVLHAKGLLSEVAAELATPFCGVSGVFHIPTREWELANGIVAA